MIGEEAGRAEDSEDPAPARWWRARRGVLAGALVTAAALCVGVLTLVLGEDAEPVPPTGNQEAGQAQTLPEALACSTLIAEGDVVAVRDAPQPRRVILTFAVQDWIKPDQGDGKVELNLLDPAVVSSRKAFEPGEHLLLIVPERREQEPAAFSGDQIRITRSQIERALPEAAQTECPPVWRPDSTVSPAPIPPNA